MPDEPLPSLSTTAKTALAIWLAQSPPEPRGASAVSISMCARLARSMVRKSAAPCAA